MLHLEEPAEIGALRLGTVQMHSEGQGMLRLAGLETKLTKGQKGNGDPGTSQGCAAETRLDPGVLRPGPVSRPRVLVGGVCTGDSADSPSYSLS